MKSPTTSLFVGSESSPGIRDLVIELIGRAEHMLIVGSFLFTSPHVADSLVEASSRGVRVYVMTSSEKGLKVKSRSHDFRQERKTELHLDVLKKLVGPCRVRSSEHWHAKFVVADPASNPSGLLLSSNLNDQAMLESPEALVVLGPIEARKCYEYARQEFWSANFEFRDANNLLKPQSNHLLCEPETSSRVLSTINWPNSILQRLEKRIDASRKSILLTSYQLFDDSPVVVAAHRACQRGISIRLITHGDEGGHNLNIARSLMEVGAEVRILDWVHAKMCLSDIADEEPSGLFTTQNFESLCEATTRRFELALEMNPQELREANLWFEYWWSQSQVVI